MNDLDFTVYVISKKHVVMFQDVFHIDEPKRVSFLISEIRLHFLYKDAVIFLHIYFIDIPKNILKIGIRRLLHAVHISGRLKHALPYVTYVTEFSNDSAIWKINYFVYQTGFFVTL